jgi:hypothetical protein
MAIVIALVLFAHGVAHLMGFAVPWKLVNTPEAPYRTTILGGAVNLGPIGVRVYGVVWLVTALAVAVVAVGLFLKTPWWYPASLVVIPWSFALSVLSWPESRIGVVLNVVLMAVLVAGVRLGWLPVLR